MTRLVSVVAVTLVFAWLLAGAVDQTFAGEPATRASVPLAADGSFSASVSLSRAGEPSETASPAEFTGSSTRAASRAAIRKVFGWGAHGDRAIKVSWCEARLYERTISPTDDWGLFALHRSVWDPARNPRAKPYWPRGKNWSDVLDPYVNARVAWAISRRGTDFWTHWRWSAGCWA